VNRNAPKRYSLLTSLVAAVAISGCTRTSLLITPVARHQELQEKQLYSESLLPDGKIAIIHIDGVMINDESPGLLQPGEHPVVELTERLDKARRDPAVKAAVLRINSPGGTVTASEVMHDEIIRFRKAGKPVVAMMMDVAASGGYYVACAADEIVAYDSTVTGSIGVIMQLFELTGTMRKIGVSAETIASGDMKGAGSPFAELQPEQRAVFQQVIDELYGQFVEVVVNGRDDLDESRVRELADGRIYTARQALEAHLIDRIGSLPDAIELAKRRSGVKRAKVVAYGRSYRHVPNYYAASPSGPTQPQFNLVNLDLARVGSGTFSPFLYLWLPR